MKSNNNNILYTPNDLLVYIDSPFSSWLDRTSLKDKKQYEKFKNKEEKKEIQNILKDVFLLTLKDPQLINHLLYRYQ